MLAVPRFRPFVFVISACSLVFACNGSDISDRPSRTALGIECTPNAALIAEQRDCQLDENCPCGAHCELGLCIASCSKDSDCEEGGCDVFGRCSADADKIPEVTTIAVGQVIVEPHVVVLDEARQGHMFIRGEGRATGPVRIVVDEGLEVSCDGATYASFCVIDNLDPVNPLPTFVDLRVSDSAVALAIAEVRVFSESGTQSFDVDLRPAPATEDNTLACSALASGVYTGTAQLVATGTDPNVPSTLAGRFAEVRIPVTARLFGSDSGQRVHFEDAHGALFGTLGAVGSFSGATTLFLQSTGYLQGQGPAANVVTSLPDESQIFTANTVDIGVLFAPGPWACTTTHLEGQLNVSFAGLLAKNPYLRWQVQLSRASDLALGTAVPAMPAPWQRAVALNVVEAPPASGTLGSFLRFEMPNAANPRIGAACPTVENCACTPAAGGLTGFLGALSTAGRSGDLLCAGGGEPYVYPLLSKPSIDSAVEVEDCLADLAAAIAGSDTGPSSCVDAGRVLYSLALLPLANLRRNALAPGTAVAQNSLDNALTLRLLQQWISVSTFVAQEADQLERRNRSIVDASIASPTYSLKYALLSSIDASALLLHPMVAPGLEGMQAGDIAAPDYRTRRFAGLAINDPDRSHEQGLGLPVSMLRTEAAQLRTLDSLALSVMRRQTSLSDLTPVYSQVIRNVLPALAVAQATYSRVESLGAPTWQAEWLNAETLMGGALVDALARYDAAVRGKNELGVEKGELPLSRVGDQQGAFSKFSALSDYLLGAPGNELAIAPSMVKRAQAKLALARDSWIQSANRDLNSQFSDLAQERRIGALAEEYGGPIISLCGEPSFSTGGVLDEVGVISPDTCFIAQACRPSFADVKGALTSAKVGYGLCMHALLRRSSGAAASPSGEPTYDALADLMPAFPDPITIQSVGGDVNNIELQLQWGNDASTSRTIHPLQVRSPPERPASSLADYAYASADRQCQALVQRSEALRPTGSSASCNTAQDCSVGRSCNAGTCGAPRRQRSTDPSCYQGALGDLALAVVAANQEVQIARAQMAEYSQSYNIAMQACFAQRAGDNQLAAVRLDHAETMEELGAAKLVATSIAVAAESVADSCDIGTVFSFGGKAAAEAAQAAAQIAADAVALRMENAQRDHENLVASIEADTAMTVCVKEAELNLVGATTATLQIKQATTGVTIALAGLNNAKNDLRRLVSEGRATLAEERDFQLPAIAGDFWLNENVENYQTSLRQAKRVVYLAVVAAEYEFQISSIEGDRALAANTPEELAQVVERLRAFTASGSVGGANPTDLINVVSLRSNLLQLTNNKNITGGWYDMSEAERFRLMMVSTKFAVYAPDGRYLGQELPFSIAPFSQFGLGQVQGIPILAGEDCAERIWSVNASIIGDNLHTSDSNLSRVTLRKRNTFFSQWCGSAGPDGSAYQVASTRGRNLFLDPQAADDSDLPQTPVSTPSVTDPTHAFTNARLQPRFNVARGELESESYIDGDSQELAGRGLYGDYALFIPAEAMALDGREGLVLSQMEDILLRFDYVSVAR